MINLNKIRSLRWISIILLIFFINYTYGSSDIGTHVSGSFEKRAVDERHFSVAIISDPQYEWACETTVCKNKASSTKDQARLSNEWHRNSILSLAQKYPNNFAGIIINGDITSFGWEEEYEAIKYIYRDGGNYFTSGDYSAIRNYPIYSGLGNHDYGNSVNDCGTDSLSPAFHANLTWNHCSYRSVWHLKETVEKLRRGGHKINFDYSDSNNFANLLKWRNIYGSLAYSWDIGDVHFVQLHNYPSYQKDFNYGYSIGVHSFRVKITKSFDWLRDDLARLNKNKLIVINLHDYQDKFIISDRKKLASVLAPYKKRIAGIFAGHIHQWVGHTWDQYLNVDGVKVPVFHSGSASYNKYLSVNFKNIENRKKTKFEMKVCKVDSTNGLAIINYCSDHQNDW